MDRRNVGRVDHVFYCFWPEGFEEAVAFWERGLGVEFEEVDLPGSGLRIVISWEAGIEIGTPIGEGDAADRMRAHLEARGEGLRSVVFGVADMAGAVAQVRAAGAVVASQIDFTPTWADRFAHVEEARLERVANMDLLLSEIQLHERADGQD